MAVLANKIPGPSFDKNWFVFTLSKYYNYEICSFNWSFAHHTYTVSTNAQSVYAVDYESQADVTVYVVDYESQADLSVYWVDYESQADEDGLWYMTDYESQADVSIYFVDYESQADLTIYYVDYESQAGWNGSNKSHLFR